LNFSIIIFCYNEKITIGKVIEASLSVVSQLGSDYEVIVVDDGSTDGTESVIKQYPQVKHLRHPRNKGIGAALRSGYAAASKEYVCAVPGDGQFDLQELLQLQPFDKHSFYSFYRPKTNYNLYRKFLTRANLFFNRLLLGIQLKDVNWIKVYRQEQLAFAAPQLESSIVESEICAKLMKAGAAPVQLPSVYHVRTAGVATGGHWKTLRLALSETWDLFLVVNAFEKKLN
jgi:dolichol-phosphate mannosyltransferase